MISSAALMANSDDIYRVHLKTVYLAVTENFLLKVQKKKKEKKELKLAE